MLPLAVLLVAAAVAAARIAAAAPLAKDACDALKSEQSALAAAGLRADMARGATWAKSNLGADRLKKITRLIEVDEQVLFRCPALPPDVEAAVKPSPAPKAKPKAAAAKQTPPESGGALAPQAGSAATSAPEKPKKVSKAEAAAEKKRAAAAKGRSRTKADDTFVPPPNAPISTLQPPAAAQPKAQ